MSFPFPIFMRSAVVSVFEYEHPEVHPARVRQRRGEPHARSRTGEGRADRPRAEHRPRVDVRAVPPAEEAPLERRGKRLEENAPVEPEGDDVYDIRTSLENDLELYADIIEGLREHVELAQNLGDHATAHLLRENLIHVEEDAHHIEHYLEDDTLVQG